jgi:hypothetical protein
MKAKIKKDFVILVEVKDSCESSATATVSIETKNMVISSIFNFLYSSSYLPNYVSSR